MKTDNLLVCNLLLEYISFSLDSWKSKFHLACDNETAKNTWLVTVKYKKF